MAAEEKSIIPGSFYASTETGGILRLHDKTPAYIRGLSTIGLLTCIGLVIVGKNEQVSLLHTPRRGIHWPSIDNEVSNIGHIKEVHMAYNPFCIDEEDQGFLELSNYFLDRGVPVYPFQTTEGKIAYNRHTQKLEIPDSEDLKSENSQLYCYIFSLNNYFGSAVELYLHYDGSQWSKTTPTLFPYPLEIYEQKKDILNENSYDNYIRIKEKILRDIQTDPRKIPNFFHVQCMRLQRINPSALEAAFKDIAKCLSIYAREIAQMNLTMPSELIIACQEGNIEKVEKILNDPNRTQKNHPDWLDERGGCALIRIMEANPFTDNHSVIIKLLIGHGADINIPHKKTGKTPLHVAAGYGHESALKLLIEAGANIDSVDIQGQTPLIFCANFSGCAKVMEILISKGANINARTLPSYRVADGGGLTALHAAVQANGNEENTLENIRTLLLHGADENITSVNGMKPINMAITDKSKREFFSLVKEVKQNKGFNINSEVSERDANKHPEVQRTSTLPQQPPQGQFNAFAGIALHGQNPHILLAQLKSESSGSEPEKKGEGESLSPPKVIGNSK
ncbi:MAG: hypothetical protein K0R24_30 [Gammaproteobacteria bacterium]|jgi:ankyrin repeat protein|nr:hypothetical protein [Gammaproteobacteria bacterium]